MLMALSDFLRDENGQDLVEYALMAALVATGTGVMMPNTVMPAISSIFSRVSSCMVNAGG
ncbi:MAG TPA: Flp family type IVb pilin [Bryobacteraceae bacterium]|nr:Flp family type IVb pilin [Bryobacteraceae bacterium]